ncbi:HNH endonuclease domain-containing protein [Aliiroseovarius marinus]|uniref:HNH endonuclease domain-containing protein n=1 Tax=Aliiroseovarius marinus TaxID=2500159 RepID=UPI001414CFAA|nr:HNH endonuclease domain-containing protein [Aliiroseovarius marinus]
MDFASLAVGMMEEAWWPGFHYRLHFSVQDDVVARITGALDEAVLRRDPGKLRRAFEGVVMKTGRDPLLRYVPQRFLRPWFAQETKGLPDHQVDRTIEKLSRNRFSVAQPIFKVLDDGIEFHPAWVEYLDRNLIIVQGWSDAIWLRFLERKNPNVPGLVEKITPALRRPPLTFQRNLWRPIIQEQGVISIYSGNLIDPASFELDHFLPRAFVAHDSFWNLTPTESFLNAEKSDLLPELSFVSKLAHQHSQLAHHARKFTGKAESAWRTVLDEYATDLGLDWAQLQDVVALEQAYNEIFTGLAGVAKRMGFPTGWSPKSDEANRSLFR